MSNTPKFRHGQLVRTTDSPRRVKVKDYDAASDAYFVGAALTSRDEGEWVASSNLRPYSVSVRSMQF